MSEDLFMPTKASKLLMPLYQSLATRLSFTLQQVVYMQLLFYI